MHFASELWLWITVCLYQNCGYGSMYVCIRIVGRDHCMFESELCVGITAW